jgi:Kef-type K+ transport system membrane component KefB
MTKLDHAAAAVIVAVATILCSAALFGYVAQRLRQPAVIGQIVAGIALGPSLLGRLPGHLTARLFPAAVMPFLSVIAQVALVMFMLAVAVVRPALRWWLNRRPAKDDKALRVSVVVALAFVSAWVTAELGLHVIFGALLLGLIMPRHGDGTPDRELLRPIDNGARLLLPVFFVTAGFLVNIAACGARMWHCSRSCSWSGS